MVVAVVFWPLADPESPFRMGWIAEVVAAIAPFVVELFPVLIMYFNVVIVD